MWPEYEKKLPYFDSKTNVNMSPHVVILGAGASLAAFPNGDANCIKFPLMNDLVEVVGLTGLLHKAGINNVQGNFEDIYNDILYKMNNQKIAKEIEQKIYNYFTKMTIPDDPTLYDYLILSLRGKDIIATFNWDPLLLEAYKRHIDFLDIENLPEWAFLHGNVGLGICNEHKSEGYIGSVCSICGKYLEPVKLLYPVREKNYNNNPFIKSSWSRIRSILENRAYFLTIFGYSAPETDIEAKSLLLDSWNNNPSKDLAEIEIINTDNEDRLRKNWDKFIVRQHYGVYNNLSYSHLTLYPRRSCEALTMATLMNTPMNENKFPKFKTIKEMHEWIWPLVEEEVNYNVSKKPFNLD